MRSLFIPPFAANVMYHDIPGFGMPIVFVHGLGCASSCDYPRVASDGALVGRRMVLIDLFGSGFSDAPEGFNYSIESHAEIVALLVAQVCGGPVDLFGHSMGGAIAIASAVRLGPLVRRIALSEPNLDPGGGPFSRRIAAMTESDYVSFGHRATVAEARSAGDLIGANSLAVGSAFATHRGATSLVEGCFPSWREMLHEFTMPKTVVFGERSLPDADMARLAKDSCAIAVVADAGHSMATENPGGLAAALRNAFA